MKSFLKPYIFQLNPPPGERQRDLSEAGRGRHQGVGADRRQEGDRHQHFLLLRPLHAGTWWVRVTVGLSHD